MRTAILFSLSIGLGAILTLLSWAPMRQCDGHAHFAENCSRIGLATWGVALAEPKSAAFSIDKGRLRATMAVRRCMRRCAVSMHARMARVALGSAGAAVTANAPDKGERAI